VLLGHAPEASPAFPPYRFVVLALIMAAQTASNLGVAGAPLVGALAGRLGSYGPDWFGLGGAMALAVLLLLRVREPIARTWR
jgi:hypothetical protein